MRDSPVRWRLPSAHRVAAGSVDMGWFFAPIRGARHHHRSPAGLAFGDDRVRFGRARPSSVVPDCALIRGRHVRASDGSRVLWVSRDDSSPHPYLVESARRAGATVRDLHWAQVEDGGRPLGRLVTLGRRRAGREHPITLKVVGPRLFMRFARATEDVIVIYELGLVGLYAGLSKVVRRDRRVVSLIEGDYQHLGRTGTAAFKLPVRRLAARLVDAFVANNDLARDYLRRHAQGTRQQDRRRLVAGRPAPGPGAAPPARRGAGPRGDAAVRERRPPHPAQGGRPADRGGRGLSARVRPVRALGHRGRPGTRRAGRADPPPPSRGIGRLPGSRGPCRPQGRPPGLPGVRVPDAAGLHRPCRGRGADHRHAGDRVADDGSGRDDRAGRPERDRRRPDTTLGRWRRRCTAPPTQRPPAPSATRWGG